MPLSNTYRVALFFILLPISGFAAGMTDSAIENEAMRSFNFRVVLENHVRVSVFGGWVKLTGQVEDEASKVLAAETVARCPGVEGIENQVRVESFLRVSSNGWFAQQIRRRLLVKAGVNPLTTIISVDDGVARLTGTTVDLRQKELTARYVRDVEGVTTVINELVVTPGSFVDDRTSGIIDDASISGLLLAELRRNPATRTHHATLASSQGSVTITGNAQTDDEKTTITQLAREVRGVLAVSNLMVVSTD